MQVNRSLQTAISPTSYSAQESDAFRLLYRNRIVIAAVVICILLTGIVILVWSLYRAQEERQKADAANAAKTAFLTRMSHDIRTPLNGILGLIEIEELREGDMQVARESRAKARVAANHLLSLINDILEMGRIEECKVTLEHESFNLKELCDNALVLCKLRASDRGITMLDTSEPYAVDQYMIGSPTHIRQILSTCSTTASSTTSTEAPSRSHRPSNRSTTSTPCFALASRIPALV